MFFYSKSMNGDNILPESGYYLVTLRPHTFGVLLGTNNERALIISLLQDILTSRSLLEESSTHTKLASHIDLLAFSILKEGIQLVVFSIAKSSLTILGELIILQLGLYYSEYEPNAFQNKHFVKPTTSIRQLIGPHDALKASVQLHCNHPDWEFDRYSSIGFFLHDRRGDWVRLWRLSYLYENNTNNYRQLMELALRDTLTKATRSIITTGPYATLKHE
mgnify:CR=1 FL=1